MARSTMATLIETLRGMTAAGTADYTLGVVTYWNSDEIQRVLDRHRVDVFREELTSVPSFGGAGTVNYYEYRSRYNNFEDTSGGSAVFIIEIASGENQGTSLWTADYPNGIVTFGSDTAGTAYFLTARSYKLNAAAADIWGMKAAHYSGAFDFSTDGHSFKRSQLKEQAIAMKDYYESLSGGGGVQSVQMDVMS